MKRVLLLFSLLIGIYWGQPAWAVSSWQPTNYYQLGDIVSHNDSLFIATLWNKSNSPEYSNSHWDGWVKIGHEVSLFEWGLDYNSGDIVEVNGELYLSKWANRNEEPESSWYWRRLGSDDYVDVSGALDIKADDPKSVLSILGQDENRNGVRDSFEANVLALYPIADQRRLAMNASFIYRALHELELDESINLLEEEATELFLVLTAWNDCVSVFHSYHREMTTPFHLYMDTLYRSLFYRFGQNEAYSDLNGNEEWILRIHERNYCQYYELTVN